MDPLTDFLAGPRARSAFVLRCLLDPPWSVRIEDEAPLGVVVMLRGSAWLQLLGPAGAAAPVDPVPVRTGDILIVRGPDHYVFADDLATPPQIVIHPGEVCTTVDGAPLHEAMSLGVRTWGNSATGRTLFLAGTYLTDGEVSRMLLDALPPVVVVPVTDPQRPILEMLTNEAGREEAGQQVVLDRLLDLVLIGALRTAFAEGRVDVPAWFRAAADPVVGTAIRRMQDDPAQPWTVASLAAAAGVSRALLARRFTQLVGEPPLTFLTSWRMALAADRLVEPGTTVSAVAREVGYSSPFTFSTAFKRHHGASPRAYRDRSARGAGAQAAQP